METQVFITTEFKRIDKRHWPPYVKNFIENPDAASIHILEPQIFAKKFNTDSYPRIIFYEQFDNNKNRLYIPRKYFHTHEEYDQFNNLDQRTKKSKFKFSPAEKEEIKERFNKFYEEERKPPLPLSMRDTFHQRDFSNMGQNYVFEMEDYCRHFKDVEFVDDKRTILEHIQNVVINNQYDEDNDGWIVENFAKDKSIVIRIHDVNGHKFSYIFDVSACLDIMMLKNKYRDLSDDILLRQARRGYPDWILYADFDDWKKLESDEDANLALSEEEVDVLNNTPYPFFINGLAGSGKSTILHYLFEHAYFNKLTNADGNKDLIFLSYSKKLVDKAYTIVKAMLETGSYHYNPDFKLSTEEMNELEKCFWPFQKYIIDNILNTDEEINRFSYDNRLTFDDFQRDYENNRICNLPNKRKYNAVMVWSVIRTFIKGRDHHSFFKVEQYRALPESDRTVREEDYLEIYRIWERWYNGYYKQNGKWDDLDLVRYALNKIELKKDIVKKYDIIFCDEVQDFTPVEMKFIITMSKYSYYDLSEFKNIPIAIAGDPNQTVIPTGFSWRRLKDIFDKSFVDTVRQNISLEEKPLNNNYRSKRTIVEFANSIQFIRKCFLSDDALNPQELWNRQDNHNPWVFIIDTKGENPFTAGFEKADCIITGEEGEYDFAEGHDVYVGNGDPIDNVLNSLKNKSKIYTAKAAKGLEFKSVILYKFANQLPASFDKILNNIQIDEGAEKYELAHFFTKLYIAVTRAKEAIYILDTQENYDKFWRHFINNEFVNSLIQKRPENIHWLDKTTGIEMGNTKEYLKRLQDDFDPSNTALSLKKDAMYAEDPKLMRKAADYFSEAGNRREAEMCLAYVMQFERKYKEAGIKFWNLSMKDPAIDAFWKGRCWDEILEFVDSGIKRITAKYMTGKMNLYDFVNIQNLISEIKYTDDTWKMVVMNIKQNVGEYIPEEQVFTVAEFLEQLAEKGFIFLRPVIAELYYKNKKYDKAIKYWDMLDDNNHKKYFEAKEATSVTKSEQIYWMGRGAKNKEILNNYSDPKLVEIYALDDRAIRIIFNLLLTPGDFDKAMAYPYKADDKKQRLYSVDPQQFIQKILLKDFSEAEFVNWVETPVKQDDLRLFTDKLTKEVIQDIFNLPQAKDWELFMQLKDNNGDRVMKRDVDHKLLSDAISVVLANRGLFMPLASCFLDVLFNTPEYNYANAALYTDIILKIFNKNDFRISDFRLSSKRNSYFKECGLTGAEVDFIKEHLCDYAEKKITSYRKIVKVDFDTIQTLCHIVEKTAPFILDEKTNNYVYDAQFVNDFYKRMLRLSQCPDELKEFFNIRATVVEAKHTNRISYGKLEKMIDGKFSFKKIIKTFDREDALWFVKTILGVRTVGKKALESLSVDIAALIYKYNFKLREFELKKDNVRVNATLMADAEIDRLFAENRIDEYAFKLFAYVWEVMLETNEERADKLDRLSKNKRLEKLYWIVDYLQVRALYQYSHMEDDIYDMKAREYETIMKKDVAKTKDYPRIEEKLAKANDKPQVISIMEDTVVGGISIELQKRRKTIWFTKDDSDLVTVEKGKITSSDDKVKVTGSSFAIGDDFRVNVLSESHCTITFNRSVYEIKM